MTPRRLMFVPAVASLALALAVHSAAAAAPAPSEQALERAVAAKVNAVREREGLAPLAVDDELAAIARRYSCEMARRGFFSHIAPDGETMRDRLRKAGKRFAAAGENIARIESADPAERAVSGWLKSPGHRENMLNTRFTRTGVGVCRAGRAVYVTQLFLRPR
jgi:uncharacterized protein YkwD